MRSVTSGAHTVLNCTNVTCFWNKPGCCVISGGQSVSSQQVTSSVVSHRNRKENLKQEETTADRRLAVDDTITSTVLNLLLGGS